MLLHCTPFRIIRDTKHFVRNAENNPIAYELEKIMSDMEEESPIDNAERNVDIIEAWDKACNQSEEFDFGDEVVSKNNMQESSMNDQELEEGSRELSIKAEFLKLHWH
jgi:hypothetical protein